MAEPGYFSSLVSKWPIVRGRGKRAQSCASNRTKKGLIIWSFA
jgi:hypothetical protein